MLNNLEKYTDNIVELFPNGKQFRIIVDATVGKFKILCKRYTDLQDLIEAFSTIDQSAFFSRQYGYNRSQTISVVNKFGYFSFGLIFEILKYFKKLTDFAEYALNFLNYHLNFKLKILFALQFC